MRVRVRRKGSSLDLARLAAWAGVSAQLSCPDCTDQLVTLGMSCLMALSPGCEEVPSVADST